MWILAYFFFIQITLCKEFEMKKLCELIVQLYTSKIYHRNSVCCDYRLKHNRHWQVVHSDKWACYYETEAWPLKLSHPLAARFQMLSKQILVIIILDNTTLTIVLFLRAVLTWKSGWSWKQFLKFHLTPQFSKWPPFVSTWQLCSRKFVWDIMWLIFKSFC